MPVLQLAYFCAGAGYVISATFLITIAESIDTLQGKWLDHMAGCRTQLRTSKWFMGQNFS